MYSAFSIALCTTAISERVPITKTKKAWLEYDWVSIHMSQKAPVHNQWSTGANSHNFTRRVQCRQLNFPIKIDSTVSVRTSTKWTTDLGTNTSVTISTCTVSSMATFSHKCYCNSLGTLSPQNLLEYFFHNIHKWISHVIERRQNVLDSSVCTWMRHTLQQLSLFRFSHRLLRWGPFYWTRESRWKLWQMMTTHSPHYISFYHHFHAASCWEY